jgi:hypothetical protein
VVASVRRIYRHAWRTGHEKKLITTHLSVFDFHYSKFQGVKHAQKSIYIRSQQLEAWLVDQHVLSLGLKQDESLCYRLIRLWEDGPPNQVDLSWLLFGSAVRWTSYWMHIYKLMATNNKI